MTMKITINDNSTHPHFYIDDVYKLFLVENVVCFSFINYNTHHIEVSDMSATEVSYYFVLYHDAFAHWVYESAIYLPIVKRLKERYPPMLMEKKCTKHCF